jgi:hypothetical protein
VFPDDNPVGNIPLLGAAFQGLSDAFNALGNIGADLPPAVRAKAQKVVVSAIIVTQVATTAATMAATGAAGAASSAGSAKNSPRRRTDK